ncbi:hypothetical protein XW81_00250 [Buchnera aphidicola (Schlechtendalia chinensis)]|uniref:Serine acetyltransferase n=1 Tax=Buchnera aphidicola subsp. Schlechtendalia chinensis TaxID=118110 RepID=A0A172WD25_BUCSC|nr:hypothetical protein [Buchnera aphidicola]ANF16869.1 hypothetical protein XW81_00250 [Buchnera aphidicola (Schlechtendalia chinensis)]
MLFQEVELIWNQILSEVQTLVTKESRLIGFYQSYVLNHKNFSLALSHLLSKKIGNSIISSISARDIIYEIYNDNPVIVLSAVRDIEAAYDKNFETEYYSTLFLYLDGFHVLQLYRISHYLWNIKRRELSIYFKNCISSVFSVDIHPFSKISDGIVFEHVFGVIIGKTIVFQNSSKTLYSVMLNNSSEQCEMYFPTIHKGVLIGAGVIILGKVEIGSESKICAGSVVLTSIPPRCVVSGNPARVIDAFNNK